MIKRFYELIKQKDQLEEDFEAAGIDYKLNADADKKEKWGDEH